MAAADTDPLLLAGRPFACVVLPWGAFDEALVRCADFTLALPGPDFTGAVLPGPGLPAVFLLGTALLRADFGADLAAPVFRCDGDTRCAAADVVPVLAVPLATAVVLVLAAGVPVADEDFVALAGCF